MFFYFSGGDNLKLAVERQKVRVDIILWSRVFFNELYFVFD